MQMPRKRYKCRPYAHSLRADRSQASGSRSWRGRTEDPEGGREGGGGAEEAKEAFLARLCHASTLADASADGGSLKEQRRKASSRAWQASKLRASSSQRRGGSGTPPVTRARTRVVSWAGSGRAGPGRAWPFGSGRAWPFGSGRACPLCVCAVRAVVACLTEVQRRPRRSEPACEARERRAALQQEERDYTEGVYVEESFLVVLAIL
eukprot:7389140-Prymnesium_polylepis.2